MRRINLIALISNYSKQIPSINSQEPSFRHWSLGIGHYLGHLGQLEISNSSMVDLP